MSHKEDLETLQTLETVSNTNETNPIKKEENISQDSALGLEAVPHNHKHHRHGMRNNQMNFLVPFTIFMPINVLILEYYWLTEPIKENEFEYYFSLLSLYFFFSMSLISYYFAVTIKNTPLDKQPPEVDHHYLPEVYKNLKRCESCNNKWKPNRAHHCRQCGTCSIRMDHHCPWTVNCVGSRNHKAFYLFCIYMGSGAAQYCYRSVYFFITESDKGTLWDYSTFFYVYWFMTNFVLFPITMMLVSLMIFHTCSAMTNVTTLENMAGTSANCFANGFNDQYFNQSVNLFDRGKIANYINFLGNRLFLFWVPMKIVPEKDGTEFPMSPPLTLGETIKLTGKLDILVSDEYYDQKKNVINDYLGKAEMESRDKNLQIAGKNFEYFKKALAQLEQLNKVTPPV